MENADIRINISKGFELAIQEAFKNFVYDLSVGQPNAEAAFANRVEVARKAKDIAIDKYQGS